MRKTLGVCLLALLLTNSASAGIMGNDTPEAPKQANAISEPTTGGEIPNDALDSITQTVLDLLAVLPSLL